MSAEHFHKFWFVNNGNWLLNIILSLYNDKTGKPWYYYRGAVPKCLLLTVLILGLMIGLRNK